MDPLELRGALLDDVAVDGGSGQRKKSAVPRVVQTDAVVLAALEFLLPSAGRQFAAHDDADPAAARTDFGIGVQLADDFCGPRLVRFAIEPAVVEIDAEILRIRVCGSRQAETYAIVSAALIRGFGALEA